MIYDFGIPDFWLLYAVSAVCAITLVLGIIMYQEYGDIGHPMIYRLCVVCLVLSAIFITFDTINHTEHYDNGLQALQDSIDMDGDIAIQSGMGCYTNYKSSFPCNRDMLDWYMDNHYNTSDQKSMMTAIKLLENTK